MSYDVIDYANSSAYPLVFKNMALIYKGRNISSATVTSAGVVTLTAAAQGKIIIDGILDIECNY